MRDRVDIKEIKHLLQDKIIDLCMQLLPTGRREGSHWVSCNPVTNDQKHHPALKISLENRPAVGAWQCFRSGDKGDVFGLIAYVNFHDVKDVSFSRQWAMDWLGIRRMNVDERRELARRASQTRVIHEQKSASNRIKRIMLANKLWQKGRAFNVDCPARRHAFDYFAGRNIPIDRQNFNLDMNTFRFSNATEYWKMAQYKTVDGKRRKIKPGPDFPAIHAAMRSPTGQLTACHVTFLDPQRPQKVNLGKEFPSKMIIGEANGSVIRLNHGKSGLPPEDDLCGQNLHAAEGIETGLQLCHALPDERLWAAGSLSNFANMPIDMECCESLIIWRDNNIGNMTARGQFDRAFEALEMHSKPISVMNPPERDGVDDYNDLSKQSARVFTRTRTRKE